ncbi:protein pelota-like [Artemia franciscana]|uniref:protein pelota-like n=1 Tax=Artemia franciscana TaxID=6661 RepID=UPI0032DBC1A0
MKLCHKSVEVNGPGVVALIPEDAEDMWHAYNLISEGDSIRASTIRKVQTESATGSSSSNRVRTTLTIRVETVDFDTQACALRVKGRNIEENQFVKMGAYHTIDLETNRKFTLSKPCWDSIAIERIESACDPTQTADLAAVLMQEGLANICLVTKSMTSVRAKIETTIPQKQKGNASQREKALEKFYENVLQAFLRHLNFDVVRCIIIGSPGFVKDRFYDYLCETAVRTENRVLFDAKPKIVLCKTSTGFKHSLKEILQDPAVLSRLSDTKAAAEVQSLRDFNQMLGIDQSRAFYGYDHVAAAAEAQAVDTLLVTDSLFRSSDIPERQKYVSLVDSVRDSGGTVRIFSSMHFSGEQLANFTGIAAILRFPMAEPEEEDDDTEVVAENGHS